MGLRKSALPFAQLAPLLALSAACSVRVVTPSPTSSYPSDLSAIVSPADLGDAGIVATVLPTDAPPAVVAIDAAVATSDAQALGGPNRGPVLAVGRAMFEMGGSGPSRTVWVVIYGPGGLVPNAGPGGGTSAPISRQIDVVDDQSGVWLTGQITSGP